MMMPIGREEQAKFIARKLCMGQGHSETECDRLVSFHQPYVSKTPRGTAFLVSANLAPLWTGWIDQAFVVIDMHEYILQSTADA